MRKSGFIISKNFKITNTKLEENVNGDYSLTQDAS